MNILFLTHRVPYAPNRGDRIRAFHLLRAMSEVGRVSVFSLVHDDAEAREVNRVPFASRVVGARVRRMRSLVAGAASLGSSRPLTHSLLNAPDATRALSDLVAVEQPDVVVAFCTGMARFALEPPLAGVPLVLDMVDVDSVKWQELAATATGPKQWIYRRETTTLAAFEARAARAARATLVVNERERDALLAIVPDARIEVVPNGIDLEAFAPPDPPADGPVVTFCGVMNYAPNEAGVGWFARDVWPLVRARRSDARFLIVGAHPTALVKALAAKDPSIHVTGAVLEVQPYLWRSSVSVAPLALARGLQNKVLEALAAGLPVVVTPNVLDGLPKSVSAGCASAEKPAEFADAVLRLLSLSPESRRAMARRAPLGGLGWPETLSAVPSILHAACGAETRAVALA